jgi:methionine-rich copper-binding protein CopC
MVIHAAIRALVIATALAGAAAAYAHAHLARANPAAGAIVTVAPSEVTLGFSEKLEPKFSTVVVRDASGKQVDKGDSRVEVVDP